MIQINNLGHNFSHGKNFSVNRPSGSGDYLLLLFKTSAIIVLHGKEITVSDNTLIVYKKHTAQCYYPDSNSFVNDWIHFDGDEAEELLSRLKIPFEEPVKLSNPALISRLIKDLSYEKHSGSMYEKELSEALFRCLFLKLSEMLINQNSEQLFAHHYHEFRLLRTDIYNYPNLDWSIELLSSKVSMSKTYFQYIYKYLFKVPCITDMINARIEWAKYNLEQTDYSVKQISSLCGYKNPEHFMRQFKKSVGITPTQYKIEREAR